MKTLITFIVLASLGSGSLERSGLYGVLGNGGAMGTALSDGDDCMGDPIVDYDARTLALGDGAAVTAWASGGSVSGWDMAQATGANQPLFVADCGNGVPCVHIVDATDHMRSASASATWTKHVMCMVFKGTAVADEVMFQWSDASATVFRNSFLQRAAVYNVVGNAAGTASTGGTLNTWNSICVDITNPTAGTYSTNGSSAASLSTLTSADVPDRATIGTGFPRLATWDFPGGKIGRVAMYNSTQDLEGLSACLKNQWGF